MNTVLFLHILTVFIAFAFTTGVGIILSTIAATGDVRIIRAAAKATRPFLMTGGIMILVGALLGFGTAQSAGFSLTSLWLIITYVAVALLLGVGWGIHQPWSAKLRIAAEASPDDKPSPELTKLLADPMVRAAGPISGILWIVIIAMMVFRPE